MDDYSRHDKGQGGSVGEVRSQQVRFDEPFQFASGDTLPAWEIAYETYGTLNADRSNAVLVCHALSGSQHAAGWHAGDEKNVGWWDNFIGPGKPLDSDRFFILSPNNLGGCHGSTGPNHVNPVSGRAYGSGFPVVTVEDWVRSQKKLAAHFGIRRFAAVVGGSLGGMQALRWAIDYPDDIGAAVVIAASARLSASNIAFNDIARRSILGDPHFHGGDFYEHNELPATGLGVARMLGHVTYLSDDLMSEKFGRARRDGDDRRFSYETEFEVESYLRYQGEKFSRKFDANTYLLMTKALDYFDPASDAGGDLVAAFAPIKAKSLLISFSSDWRFPPWHSHELVRALLAAHKPVSYLEIESASGHDSFLLADPTYHKAVATFMRGLEGG